MHVLRLLANTGEELHRRTVEWQEALQREDLKINAEVKVRINCTREGKVEAVMSDKKKDILNIVGKLKCLGSTISEISFDGEMIYRVGAGKRGENGHELYATRDAIMLKVSAIIRRSSDDML